MAKSLQLLGAVAGRPDVDVDVGLRRVLRRPRAVSAATGRSLRHRPQPADDESVDADLADDRHRDVRRGGLERVGQQVGSFAIYLQSCQ